MIVLIIIWKLINLGVIVLKEIVICYFIRLWIFKMEFSKKCYECFSFFLNFCSDTSCIIETIE